MGNSRGSRPILHIYMVLFQIILTRAGLATAFEQRPIGNLVDSRVTENDIASP